MVVWEMKNWQREQMPRKWKGKGTGKAEIAMEHFIKRPRKSGRRMEKETNR